eukprot:808457-Pelagomonas_calceolata.AAC.5
MRPQESSKQSWWGSVGSKPQQGQAWGTASNPPDPLRFYLLFLVERMNGALSPGFTPGQLGHSFSPQPLSLQHPSMSSELVGLPEREEQGKGREGKGYIA